MRKSFFSLIPIAVLFLAANAILSFGAAKRHETADVQILSQTQKHIQLGFAAGFMDKEAVSCDEEKIDELIANGVGFTFEPGKPILPAVSRIVVVHPDAGLDFRFTAHNTQRVKADVQPMVCTPLPDGDLAPRAVRASIEGIYPPAPAAMSEPSIIRGVRVVTVTTYPVQYDFETGEYIFNDYVETDINYTGEDPVNPVLVPVRKNRSKQFLKFIQSLAINGDVVGRDDPQDDEYPEYLGHYLIVSHENCLEYAVPFIEWRRKSGWKIDIISLDQDQANNTDGIKNAIANLYNEYLQDGVDPFDHILIIGDLARYNNLAPPPNWIVRPNGVVDDWYFACIEGNDDDADAAISRWCSGSEDLMRLFVYRTMMYEATPNIEEPEWFERAAVYAQRWGRNYHISLATNVRWGRKVLETLNFTDIRVEENIDQHDGGGQIVGPFIRDQYNDGASVMIGRAENYYFRGNLPGVHDNNVFPVDIYLGGHQEYSVWTLLRTGTADHPKGPVAATSSWGNPPTLPQSVIWMEMVNGFLQRDLTFGWARLQGIMGPANYIANIRNEFRSYRQIITCYGDPALHYWNGMPQVVEAEFPAAITTNPQSFDVKVFDAENEDRIIQGAQVTIYVPGETPEADDPEYVDYDEMFMLTRQTDATGNARFLFPEDIEFDLGEMYITVTGRDILPLFGECEIRQNVSMVDVAEYTLTEIEGNEDGEINPGETFQLGITAANIGRNDAIRDITAFVSCESAWITVENDNRIEFVDLDAEESSDGNRAVTLTVHPTCPDGEARPSIKPVVEVLFETAEGRFISLIELTPKAPHFVLRRILGGDDVSNRPRSLDLYITNIGNMDAPPLSAQLMSLTYGVNVILEQAQFPAIRSGRYNNVDGDRFRIVGSPSAIPGTRYDMKLLLETENGFSDTVYFDLQFGEPDDDGPYGPDKYGYLCFDDTDDDWAIAPDFDWIEISPRDRDRDFDGEEFDFDGNSPQGIGEAIAIDLPFETQFYGRVYDEITVTTNGFISMGEQEWVTNFQNWPLDRCIGGGVGMIAPFWDCLAMNDNSGVYYFYDEENGRFIVEWHRMRHGYNDDEDLTFQAILYDRDVWETITGDQNILFQYLEISNNQGNGGWQTFSPYASVGISSWVGDTGINYTFNNVYPSACAQLQDGRAILFSTSPKYFAGILQGWVQDHETEEPVANAVIATEHGLRAVSDEDGFWRIEEALAEVEFELTCFKQGYNDSILGGLFLEEDDTLEIDFSLLHPELVPSRENVFAELQSDDEIDLELEIANEGNGPLTFNVERRLPGNAEANPWELRGQMHVGRMFDDSRIQGAVFVHDRFYVASAHDHDPQIFVLNRDGELVNQFEQFGESRYGFRDMTWDGELIWGSGEQTVYGFTPEGEVAAEFEGPYNPTHNFAWDPDREVLWVSSTTSDIMAIDREGNEINDLDRLEFRIYGLAYYPEDPDGYTLYIFHKNREIGDQIIHKMNPADNDTMFVRILNPEEGGNPISAQISNQFDVYSWVFLSVANNGNDDRLDLWQLDTRRDWFHIQPLTGVITPEQMQNFTINLNSADLPAARFAGDFVFITNAGEGIWTLPVTLNVLGARDRVHLELQRGWNQVSINVQPENLDIEELTAPLTENDNLVFMKDGAGRFYYPALGFNNIENWRVEDGYMMYVNEPDELAILGAVIPADRTIELEEGWNLKSYYPRIAVDPVIALSGIREQLVIAKNGAGGFYLPEFDYSNMERMTPLQGYQFKVTQDVELVYAFDEQNEALFAEQNEPAFYRTAPYITGETAEFMPALIIGDEYLAGCEIGVYDSDGNLLGADVFDSDGKCGVAVWGRRLKPGTENDFEGENLTFKLWDKNSEYEIEIEKLRGAPVWTAEDYFVGKISENSKIPVEFGVHDLYPNPVNGPVTLKIGVDATGIVTVNIFDLNGRLCRTLHHGEIQKGVHNLIWNTRDVSSGIYFVSLVSDSRMVKEKIVVLK